MILSAFILYFVIGLIFSYERIARVWGKGAERSVVAEFIELIFAFGIGMALWPVCVFFIFFPGDKP